MPETMYLLNIMKYVFMKAWADTIMTVFIPKIQMVIPSPLSTVYLFSSSHHEEIPSTKWKRNHILPFSLLLVFSYGWERGQHKVNTSLKYHSNPALRIYTVHWRSQGSLYRYALARGTYECLEGRISSFSYLQCLGCSWVHRLALLAQKQVCNMLLQ